MSQFHIGHIHLTWTSAKLLIFISSLCYYFCIFKASHFKLCLFFLSHIGINYLYSYPILTQTLKEFFFKCLHVHRRLYSIIRVGKAEFNYKKELDTCQITTGVFWFPLKKENSEATSNRSNIWERYENSGHTQSWLCPRRQSISQNQEEDSSPYEYMDLNLVLIFDILVNLKTETVLCTLTFFLGI